MNKERLNLEEEKRKILSFIEELEKIRPSIEKIWKKIILPFDIDLELDEKNILIAENKIMTSKQIFSCPECGKNLKFNNNKLISGSEEICFDSIVNIDKKINSIKDYQSKFKISKEKKEIIEEKLKQLNITKIPKPGEYDEIELSMLYKIELNQISLEKSNDTIKKIKLTRHYNDLKKQLKENYFEWFDNYNFPSDYTNYYEQFCNINRKLKESSKVLKENKFTDLGNIEADIILKKKIEKKLEDLNRFKKVLEVVKKINIYEEKYDSCQKKKNNIITTLESINKIKKVIIKTENQFLETVLNNLNIEVNEILNLLFNNIYFELSMFKQTKKELKPQVNIRLVLNNNEYDNLNDLSGGEKDILSIALTLAFNKLSGSNILMLDEPMASLDSVKRQNCLNVIKNYTKNKIVVNVCHETIEGFYHNVIEI